MQCSPMSSEGYGHNTVILTTFRWIRHILNPNWGRSRDKPVANQAKKILAAPTLVMTGEQRGHWSQSQLTVEQGAHNQEASAKRGNHHQ
jgi:hypothetical protein